MADEQPRNHRSPGRFKALHVVADTVERDEHLTIGVLIDGAFIPIAQHPLGYVESQKQRWNEIGGSHVDDAVGSSTQHLEDRLAKLERALIAAGVELEEPAPAAGEHANE